ncbi:MAG: hypothetical protein E6I84_14385 [Chloroflexi bacterium]|nr:MAG: hypothetical protein E6I84_14385 [Chloroflexota bacterium]
MALPAAAVLVALTARRPLIGCAALAVGVPLTTALGRDTVIPVLRPNEVLLLLVLAGFALHHLWYRRTFYYLGIDLAIAGFATGCVLIPWLVLFLGHTWIDFDTWRAVLGPLQFLVVYLCFAQLRLSDTELQRLLNLTLASFRPIRRHRSTTRSTDPPRRWGRTGPSAPSAPSTSSWRSSWPLEKIQPGARHG